MSQNFAKQSAQDFSFKQPETNEIEKTPIFNGPWPTHTKSSATEMCMNKWTLMAIFGTLFALIFIQALIVTKYMFKRILSNNNNNKKQQQKNGSINSFHY